MLAQKKLDADTAGQKATVVNSPEIDLVKAKQQAAESQKQVLDDRENGGPRVLREEAREEHEVRQSSRRSSRRKTSGFDAKSISERVAGSLHGRSHAILHADGAR
jgi:hypothetical protein